MRPVRLSYLLPILLLAPPHAHSGEKPPAPLVFRGKTLVQWSGELHSVDARTRRRAATALSLGPFGKRAVPALLNVPRDGNQELPPSVLMALSQHALDSPEVVPVLMPKVEFSLLFSVPVLTLDASRLGPACIPLLQDRIRKEEPAGPFFNWAVFSGMDQSALPLLKQSLKDEHGGVRAMAATALGEMSVASAVPLLLPLLDDKETSVRSRAMEALGKLGLPPAAVPLLVERARVGDSLAISALASMGKPGIAALRLTFAAAELPWRLHILENVARAGRDAFPLLLEGLQHPESRVRCAAARGLAFSPAALDEVLPHLLKALSNKDKETRECVVTALNEIVPPRRDVVLTLARTLFDDDFYVSRTAASALSSLGPHARAAVPTLLEALKDRNANIRTRAAIILGDVRSVRRDIVLALCDCLSDREEEVRRVTAEALGRLGPDTLSIADEVPAPGGTLLTREIVLPALRRCLRDRDQKVRIAAAASLVQLGDHQEKLAKQLGLESLDPAGQLLGTSSDLNRYQALCTLDRMGKEALPALPFLLLTLREDKPGLSIEVMFRLASLGPAAREAIPALRRTLHSSRHESIQCSAARTLAQLGEEGQAVLREALALADKGLHQIVLEGLQLAGPRAKALLPDVLRLSRDAQGGWKLIGLRTLRALDARGDEARHILTRALESENEEVCKVACQALGAMGAEARDALPRLLDCLLEPQAELRREAVMALRNIGPDDKRVLPALIETMTDPDPSVQKAGVEALGSAGRPALAALRTACRDRDDGVRIAAACALSRLGDRDESSRVLRAVMLDRKDGTVRVEACLALWKQERTREVVPVLAQLLRQDDGREAAVKALSKLDGVKDDVIAFLRPLLNHELRAVRKAAWQVLEKTAPEVTFALANAR